MNVLVLLPVLLVGLFVALPIIAAVLAGQASKRAEAADHHSLDLARRVASLEEDLRALKERPAAAPPAPPADTAAALLSAQTASRRKTSPPREPARAPSATLAEAAPHPPAIPAPPPILEAPASVPAPFTAATEAERAADAGPGDPTPPLRVINWEQFMGVKLFAWLGGLALFLGVGFFVKYSFDQGLISPPVRVGIGLVTGLGLLLGGLRLSREKYAVTVQALCATGLLILYADAFASCSFYHFLAAGATFPLMVAVTVAAFLLAVRLDAPAVAVLGLLGGFLTPPLLSTGEDHPAALFGYLAILDVGLIAVALRKRWTYLVLLSAVATIVMQYGWVGRFFATPKFGVAFAIFVGFSCLFVGALGLAHRRGKVEKFISAAALAMPGAAFLFALSVLAHPYPAIADRPGMLFSFVIAVDLSWLAVAWLRTELRPVALAAGIAVFLLLAIWTVGYLETGLLGWALGFYLVFAILHAGFPVVLERLRPAGTPIWWAHLFAPLALVLVLVPIFKLEPVSLALWPVILLVDLLAVALATVTLSLLAIVAVLLLTVVATACWILSIPAAVTGAPEILLIIGGFAIFFFFAGQFAARRIMTPPTATAANRTAPWSVPPADAQAMIPALSAILPFLLLTLVVLRLPLVDPSPVFGLAALMVVLSLAVVRFYETDWLTAIVLISLLMLECAWHFNRFESAHALVPLAWYVGFYAVFAAFPFLFQKRMTGRVIPWAVAALAGPAQFYLVYKLAAAAFPNRYMGLLPAAFAVPCLVSLAWLAQSLSPEDKRRTTLLAFFGGVALFFITLIFPIQFERQWITIGWGLEGAALLWLLHRVPHDGLKATGVGLLVAAFVRLALNPAVLRYHPHTGTPILNWYLYAYGLVTLSLFIGARLLAPPRHRLGDANVPPLLQGLGTVLAFLLVNLEIADYFTVGPVVTFEFSGSFARDMTYSLGWATFAFVVMIVGIARAARAARYGGIALLTVTLAKLFLHDLWSLGGLYRIGALIGLALVLIPVSFLYQRFLLSSSGAKPPTVREGPAADKPRVA
jgi:uncharacterized membrane protein